MTHRSEGMTLPAPAAVPDHIVEELSVITTPNCLAYQPVPAGLVRKIAFTRVLATELLVRNTPMELRR